MRKEISIKVNKALKYSLLDGVSHSIMLGFGEQYFLAYAILMSANDLELGLVATLPILIASILQLFSIQLMHKMKSRKRAVVLFASMQAVMFIPLILIYHLLPYRISGLIFFVTLYWIFGLMTSPIWAGWIGDLVPTKIRGKYFSTRYLATGIAGFLPFLIGGFILSYAKDILNEAYFGFALMFFLAMLARIFSIYFLLHQYEPPFKEKKENEFSLKEFITNFSERFKKGHFNTLVLYLSLISFGVYFIAPYIVAFMLKDLQFSYLQYVIATATYLFVQVVLYPAWGRVSDKYGSLAVIKLTGLLISITPILWMFPKTLFHVILIQIYAGFIGSGFLLGSFNLLLETTTPEKRITAMSYYHLVNGIFIFLGSLSAAIILELIVNLRLTSIPYIGGIFWSSYVMIFLLSGIFRIIVTLKIIPKLKEVKRHKRISSKELAVKVITEIPNRGIHLNLHAQRG